MMMPDELLTINHIRKSLVDIKTLIDGTTAPEDLYNIPRIIRPLKPVYIQPPCIPVRLHKFKRWMKHSYHVRIQKKWNKRYGLKHFDKIIETPDGYFVPAHIYYQNTELMQILQGYII